MKRSLIFGLVIVTLSFSQLLVNGKELKMEQKNSTLRRAVFAGGCFWCTEAIFQDLRGVERVTSGYTGGVKENPTYEEVCTGTTGHAEAIEILYDPNQISYEVLLEVFGATHDPTTLNRQGADRGTQYRSSIFYADEQQHQLAIAWKNSLDLQKIWPTPVVTEIVPLKQFFPAEKYHQDYYRNHTQQGYCQIVISPKLEKFRKHYASKLK